MLILFENDFLNGCLANGEPARKLSSEALIIIIIIIILLFLKCNINKKYNRMRSYSEFFIF